MHNTLSLLKTYYGYESFRPGQSELIDFLLSGRDVLGIMPTGGGKSLCYQLPAIAMPGTALVISPLISLMKDQVDTLTEMGVQAAFLNSQMDFSEQTHTISRLRRGNLDMLYIAPERLDNSFFQDVLQQVPISMVAVDEAHCISQWGSDFRPSYQNIVRLRQWLPEGVPFGAFTATATERVREDIERQLELRDPYRFTASFDRPNLHFAVVSSSKKRDELLRNMNAEDSTIIYCNTRKHVEEVAAFLTKKKFPAAMYHGGMTAEARNQNQEDFLYDKKLIMVATNAFGMGIDKPDVRKVIHYNMPLDLESYYQEAGRAGRDSSPAEAILLYSAQDILTNSFLVEQGNQPNAKERLQRMTAYCKTGQCLRGFLLRYFDEEPLQSNCSNCTNCLGQTEVIDITVASQKIISCVARMQQRYGAGLIVDVLRGKDNQRIREQSFNELSTYGIMREYSENEIKDMISILVSENGLAITGSPYPILQLTPQSRTILTGKQQLSMVKKKETKKVRVSQTEDLSGEQQELFEELRQVRLELAREHQLAPFMIFSDRSLRDMIARLPGTKGEFLEVHGVGEKKWEEYGALFMERIASWSNEMNADEDI